MSSSVFREYDVRGLVDTDLSEDFYHRLGLAFGSDLRSRGARSAVVGRDLRPSSGAFAAALRRGLAETGMRVLDVGEATTPMVVFARTFLGAHASAAVTASHNPAEYNGAKLRRRTPVYGRELQELRSVLEAGRFTPGRGSEEAFDVRDAYQAALRGRARAARALKVVADAGNGAAGLVAPEILSLMGFEVVPLYCDPDGTFPNHHPDPTVLANLEDLREKVLEENADCGVAFDGDADRCVVLDEQGVVHWPDRILMALAVDALARRPGGVVVCDVKCSQGVKEVVEAHGGRHRMVKTGYPHLLAGMADPDSVVGAELSGHVYFGQDALFDFDDGVHAAARTLELFSRDPRPVSRQLADLPSYCGTPEIQARVDEARKFAVTAALVDAFRSDPEVVDLVDTDGARAIYPEGWGLVRASNTGPKLIMVFEARDEAGVASLKRRFAEKLARFPEVAHDLS